MAAALLQEISQDERERARALSRKKFETDLYSNLHTAERRGALIERDKWQGVIAEKDISIANKEAEIERLRLENAELRAKSK